MLFFKKKCWNISRYDAEQRMLHHRWRLTHRGVQAERLQPEWCRRNGGQCYWKDDYPFREHKFGKEENET